MSSLRRHEGYFSLDNRAGDPMPEELLRAAGLPPGAGRGLFETPHITCSHCQVNVIMSPTRVRARAYCPKCDHYICDVCEGKRVASGGACKTWKQVLDEAEEAASRGQPVIILP